MNENSFEPNWMSAPGATIIDILEERGLSSEEFAELLGYSLERTQKLLNGKTAITKDVARLLAKTIGGTENFWMSREEQYRGGVARLQSAGDTNAGKAWLDEIPLKDMVKFGWISSKSNLEEKVDSCLQFFNVPNVTDWRNKYRNVLSAVAFRTSPKMESEPGAVLAWLRYGEIKSEEINCKPWNANGFERELIKIRRLTRKKNPKTFIPELRTLCAKHGVALVVARAPAGCRASGATYFVNSHKAMLLLSFRYLSDDQFWFTFFHEAGHLLLHSHTSLFLEDGSDVTLKEEHEANLFAQNILVPPEARVELSELPAAQRDIMRFSIKVGVSRGIIVGQLQHMKKIPPDKLNWLKHRFKWDQLERA
jgi:plasmid maintenance system antidote protein VapI/Zn-dependent peptidase ImmA (M78 family)